MADRSQTRDFVIELRHYSQVASQAASSDNSSSENSSTVRSSPTSSGSNDANLPPSLRHYITRLAHQIVELRDGPWVNVAKWSRWCRLTQTLMESLPQLPALESVRHENHKPLALYRHLLKMIGGGLHPNMPESQGFPVVVRLSMALQLVSYTVPVHITYWSVTWPAIHQIIWCYIVDDLPRNQTRRNRYGNSHRETPPPRFCWWPIPALKPGQMAPTLLAEPRTVRTTSLRVGNCILSVIIRGQIK